MKMLPVQLSLNPPLGLWSDVLWRCPPAPPSQLAELKTQLPASLPSDPRLWGREDVTVFLRFCEREFDLPKVDHDLFQMNGKALCLLTRADFGHRCPGAGDVLHNVLQMLIIESHMMQWHLPNSPVTPTSRYPLSPHSHPPTPTWPPIAPPESPFHNAAPHMHHFMAPNSVTLSPPPSVDSQASSPPQGQDQNGANVPMSNGVASGSGSGSGSTSSNGSGSSSVSMGNAMGAAGGAFGMNPHGHAAPSNSSNQSDSDEESYSEAKNNAAVAAAAAAVAQYNASPPTTPILKDMPQSLSQKITNSFVNSWSQSQAQAASLGQKLPQSSSSGGSVSAPTTPSYMQPVKREFFPENSEPNTNGRLLWDFLQQLLNDRNQKYSDLIAWKCRDTGVFKIVDPAGLAKLWGIQKNHLSMNYDKMSRALRYYYRVNILRKVQGERHCYQFLRNPTELKNIKNISLLRQSVRPASPTGAGSSAGVAAVKQENNQSPSAASMNGGGGGGGGNWPLTHQSMAAAAAAAAAAQQQQQPPQSPSARSNHNHNHMSLPTISSSAAAAMASSPLFMHAINGAFHYLSANGGPPPNSPILPSTPSDKFQFNALKLEHNGGGCVGGGGGAEHAEEMKPTDLSVSGAGVTASGSEKRPYSSPSANEDCYPLIRNADGLTTIKLIRYNETGEAGAEHRAALSPNQLARAETAAAAEEHMQQSTAMSCAMPMESDGNSSESNANNAHFDMMPTDLRK